MVSAVRPEVRVEDFPVRPVAFVESGHVKGLDWRPTLTGVVFVAAVPVVVVVGVSCIRFCWFY